MKSKSIDKPFFITVIVLTIVGFLIFSSASLGLLTRQGAQFGDVTFNQVVFGIILGGIAMIVASRINYRHWRAYAFYIFLASLILTALTFVPKIGFEHGGAKRWLVIMGFSFQPAEFLKIGFIIYLAAWISGVKHKIATWKQGVLPFMLMVGITGLLLMKQPDTGTFLVLFISGVAMFMAGGGSYKHIVYVLLGSCVGLLLVAYMRPYLWDRITTFLHPEEDSLGASYQIQQSLIAIGGGGLTGRGFGQSVQKFNFLPEPIGDSIFAVEAEEFGFIGSVFLIALYVFFAFRGLKIAQDAPDLFGGLLVVGIVILVLAQSFINMATMLSIFPLTGIPLLFVSHGGTALFTTLAEVGIILNISKYRKTA